MEMTQQMDLLATLNIGPLPKAMIALVIYGVKPAVELDLFVHNDSPEKVIKTLNAIGLHTIEVIKNRKKESKKYISTFCIASKQSTATILATLAHARENEYGKQYPQFYHELYWVLMGYPLTAIDGFIKDQKLEESDYPESMANHDLLVFQFSKAHWEDEMKTIEEWQAILEHYAPAILSEVRSCYVP